jgi:haloacid dehalogenase-like hydrolase
LEQSIHQNHLMPLLPFDQFAHEASNICLIASDVDGTLTHADRFTPQLLEAIAQLAQANLPLLLVTGCSTGWVDYEIICS